MLIFKRNKPASYNKEMFFHTLGPTDNADDKNIYYTKFMNARDKGCKIIAFTGKYGIGKSSIINSIIKKLSEENYIKISLGNYKEAESEESLQDNLLEDTINLNKKSDKSLEVNNIELKILQQIIYTTDENKLPMSRFKRIKYISKFNKVVTFIFSILITLLLYIFETSKFEFVLSNLFKKTSYFKYDIVPYFLCTLLICFFIYSIYKFLMFLKIKINMITFKYKNLEFSIGNNENNSIFNLYMDEIVYFFKQIGTKYLIIEDLDRYGNMSLEIFKKLKELNYMLNANKVIKKRGGVIFVYALRDDLFKNCEDRVKFFDSVIPIVSKFSNQNCKEYAIELYEEMKEYNNLIIDEKLFSLLSIYIDDRRLLLNIFMEFKTYIDVLKENQDINYTQLFALLSYKNINPIDFEKRNTYSGDLYSIFEMNNDLIQAKNSSIENEIKIIKNEIDEKRLSNISDMKIIKKAFIVDILKDKYINYQNFNNINIYINDDKYTVFDFINTNFDFNDIYNKSMFIESNGKDKISQLVIDQLLAEYERINFNSSDKESIIMELQEEKNKNLDLKLGEILNIYKIKDIIFEYDNKLSEKFCNILNNKILISMIKGGFIKENYEKCITFFKSGDLKSEDNSFIVLFEMNERIEFSYKLSNVHEVIDRINVLDFKNENILNFDICDCLLNNQKYNSRLKNFLSLFDNINNYKFDFLLQYSIYNFNNFGKIISKIFSIAFFQYVLKNKNKILNYSLWIKYIVESIKLEKYNDTIIYMKKALEEKIEIFNEISLNSISTENIKLIKPIFLDYSDLNKDLFEILYNEKIFLLNRSLYEKLIDENSINQKYKQDDMIDLLFEDERLKNFREKILYSEEFISLYNSFSVFKSKENNILSIINDTNIDKIIKYEVLNKEVNKITSLSDVTDSNLWDYIVENNNMNLNIENLLTYYEYTESINDTIMNLLNCLTDYHFVDNEKFQEFEKELLYSNELNKVSCSKIAKVYNLVIEEFDNNKELNKYMIDELILNKKIKLNINTYNYFVKEYKIYLSKLILSEIDDFIEICENIENDKYIINFIIESKEIDIAKKIKILEIIGVDLVDVSNLNLLVIEIINLKCIISENLFDFIFNKVKEAIKIKLFIYLNEFFSKAEYLHKINVKTKKIRDGITTHLTFDNTEELKELILYLKTKKIINSYTVENNKIKISYPKSYIN